MADCPCGPPGSVPPGAAPRAGGAHPGPLSLGRRVPAPARLRPRSPSRGVLARGPHGLLHGLGDRSLGAGRQGHEQIGHGRNGPDGEGRFGLLALAALTCHSHAPLRANSAWPCTIPRRRRPSSHRGRSLGPDPPRPPPPPPPPPP